MKKVSDSSPRPQKLHLPFEKKNSDIGEWAYDHRVGLCVTLIVYLLLGIAFVGGKILVGTKPSDPQIIVDIQTPTELEMEKARLEQQLRENLSADRGSVSNQYSDENAREIRASAERMNNMASDASATSNDEGMRANREAWERGLAEERAIRDRANRTSNDPTSQTTRSAGRVTVSYDLEGRQHRHLEVPAYRCQGGGKVVIGITVDNSGEVIAAKNLSGGDACMQQAALSAARRSFFNIDNSAPARQEGTITYEFIPQ